MIKQLKKLWRKLMGKHIKYIVSIQKYGKNFNE